ncbi:type III-B CRISPR module RAMP protein Cmr1, partial [Methanosarcinales archaeon]
MEVRVKTPIWTGDVDGKCSKIKETGIICSLRWWYEALVGGFGGYACDPTSEGRCPEKWGKMRCL